MTAKIFQTMSKAGSAVLFGLLVLLAPTAAVAKQTKKKGDNAKSRSSKSASRKSTSVASSAGVRGALTSDAPFTNVVLDAGHGGHDPGGIPSNLIPEKGVALDVTKRVASHLKSAGIPVVLTRSDDTFVTLSDRVRVANENPDSIFVSIHFNSGMRVGAKGMETFYSSPAAAPLAARIQHNLMSVSTGDNRGVKRAPFYVLRNARVRAVLAECGFLTNPEEAALAAEPLYRERLAVQISQAIIEYHQAVNRGSRTG